jgi:hypothetical protein
VSDDEPDVSHICAAGDRAGRARSHGVPDSACPGKFRIGFADQITLERPASRVTEIFESCRHSQIRLARKCASAIGNPVRDGNYQQKKAKRRNCVFEAGNEEGSRRNSDQRQDSKNGRIWI